MSERGRFLLAGVKCGGGGAMGDLNCPKCGNNSFQARSHVNDPHTVTFICVACWEELLLENLTL